MFEENVVKLSKEQFVEAKSVAYLVNDDEKRKLAFVNSCALFALKNYVEKNRYKFAPVTNINLFRVPAVVELFEISDLYIGNIRIDVRVSLDENHFPIPKTHIKNSLAADFYVVFIPTKNPLKCECIGYVKKEDLVFDSQDDKYYYISVAILNPINELKKEIENYTKEERVFYETEHRISTENFGAFLDGELDFVKSLDLIEHLLQCADCRGKFVEYSFLEDVLTAVKHYPEIKEDIEDIFKKREEEEQAFINETNEKIEIRNEELIQQSDNLAAIFGDEINPRYEKADESVSVNEETILQTDSIEIGQENEVFDLVSTDVTDDENSFEIQSDEVIENMETISNNTYENQENDSDVIDLSTADYNDVIIEDEYTITEDSQPLEENQTEEIYELVTEDDTPTDNILLIDDEVVSDTDLDFAQETYNLDEENLVIDENQSVEVSSSEEDFISDNLDIDNSIQQNESEIVFELQNDEELSINDEQIDFVQDEISLDYEINLQEPEIQEEQPSSEVQNIEEETNPLLENNEILLNTEDETLTDDGLQDVSSNTDEPLIVLNNDNEQDNESFSLDYIIDDKDAIVNEELKANFQNDEELQKILNDDSTVSTSTWNELFTDTRPQQVIEEENIESLEAQNTYATEEISTLYDENNGSIEIEETFETDIPSDEEENVKELKKNNSGTAVALLTTILAISVAAGGFVYLYKNPTLFKAKKGFGSEKVLSSNSNESNKDMNKVMTDAFSSEQVKPLAISKMTWLKSASLVLTPDLKEYMNAVADSVWNELEVNLVSLQDQTVDNPCKILILINKKGEVKDVKLGESSGSKTVDNEVIRSVKAVLDSLTPSAYSIKGQDVNLTLVVNF